MCSRGDASRNCGGGGGVEKIYFVAEREESVPFDIRVSNECAAGVTRPGIAGGGGEEG